MKPPSVPSVHGPVCGFRIGGSCRVAMAWLQGKVCSRDAKGSPRLSSRLIVFFLWKPNWPNYPVTELHVSQGSSGKCFRFIAKPSSSFLDLALLPAHLVLFVSAFPNGDATQTLARSQVGWSLVCTLLVGSFFPTAVCRRYILHIWLRKIHTESLLACKITMRLVS